VNENLKITYHSLCVVRYIAKPSPKWGRWICMEWNLQRKGMEIARKGKFWKSPKIRIPL